MTLTLYKMSAFCGTIMNVHLLICMYIPVSSYGRNFLFCIFNSAFLRILFCGSFILLSSNLNLLEINKTNKKCYKANFKMFFRFNWKWHVYKFKSDQLPCFICSMPSRIFWSKMSSLPLPLLRCWMSVRMFLRDEKLQSFKRMSTFK